MKKTTSTLTPFIGTAIILLVWILCASLIAILPGIGFTGGLIVILGILAYRLASDLAAKDQLKFEATLRKKGESDG